MERRAYLDNSAATPLRGEALDAMVAAYEKCLGDRPGAAM